MSNPPNPNDPSAPDGYNDPLTPQEGNPNDGQTSQYGQIPQDPQNSPYGQPPQGQNPYEQGNNPNNAPPSPPQAPPSQDGFNNPYTQNNSPYAQNGGYNQTGTDPYAQNNSYSQNGAYPQPAYGQGNQGTRATKEIRFHTNKEAKTHTDRINLLMGLTLTRLHNTFLRTLVPQTPMVAVPG